MQNETESQRILAYPSRQTVRSWVLVLIAIVASYGLYQILPYEPNPRKGLCLLLFVAILWLTEALHITITALCVPVAAVLMGIGSGEGVDFKPLALKTALSNFANPTIYLFFGGFALATALHVQQLDRKIAMKLISMTGGSLGRVVFAIAGVTALLSMWVSNTATAAMMLPLVVGIMSQMDEGENSTAYSFILLSIAYSASIGGLGTMVGSPPNAIASAELKYGFFDWMKIGLPVMLVMFPWMLFALKLVFKPDLSKKINMDIEQVPWTRKRVITIILFVATALCWMFSKQLKAATGLPLDDTLIALCAAILIAVLGLATWKEIANGTEWGILLLFGGGLALSGILKDSGASLILGKEVARVFGGAPEYVIVFVVMLFIVCLTEFTSNTASAALLVPVFASVAPEMGLPVELLVLVIGIGASCAFMLPIATPPNAIIFGTGKIRQRDMVRAGAVIHIGNLIFVPAFLYLLYKVGIIG